MTRRTTHTVRGAVLGLTLVPVLASAQQAPPPPLPLQEVAFPEFRELTLSNGARAVVVTNEEIPFVTVNLVIPGGTAADPAGKEGAASLVAQLLTQGTSTRGQEEMAEAVDFLGATLGAGAGRDEISVTLGSLTSELDEALALMADAVLNPIFPEDRLELLRTQNLSALQVSLSQAATVASRAFTRAVYGGHPYGRLETPASLQALTRDDLVAYHREHFAPSTALFVVAGDITAAEAAARLEEAFRGWSGDGRGMVAHPTLLDRAAPEVILVHKPGSVQAEVRVGHLLEEGDHPDWTPLAVANQVLGGGSSGRLFQILREEKGYTYGAYSSMGRARGQGTFQAGMAVRNEVLGEALTELLTQIQLLRDRPVPAGEMADTKAFLVGSFPLQLETPQQVAARVAANRLLGLPEDALETYRSRVAALDAATVQEVFRRHVDPGKVAVVVVGDATVLLDALRIFGPVRLEDVEGNRLDVVELAPRGRSRDFSAVGLEPMTLDYQVSFQGNPVGSTRRSLSWNADGTLAFIARTELGPQAVVQTVTVRPETLEFVTSGVIITVQGKVMGGEVRRQGNRLVGSLTSPVGDARVDMEVPEDVMVSDMLELALWVAELDEGTTFEIPVANVQAGTVENVHVRVAERTELTVPGGTFPVFRVEVGGSEAQTVWVRVAAPHVVVRLVPASQPVSLELISVGAGG